MRKSTITAALLGALALGGTALAAQPPVGQPGQPRAEPQHDGQRGPGRHGRQRGERQIQRRVARVAFRGIELTDAQRQQIRTVHTRFAEERRTALRDARAKWQAASPDAAAGTRRTRPDSAARTAMHNQLRASLDREVAELRGVLTAEQRPVFDRNVAELRERMAQRQREHGAPGRGGRGERQPRGAVRG